MRPTIPTEWSPEELAGFLRDLAYEHEDNLSSSVTWTAPVRTLLPGAEHVAAFHLVRERNGPRGTCPRAFIERGGERTALPYVIQHHDLSGLGWDWAHLGTRSADLALNILATLVSPKEAWRMHYPFMKAFLRHADLEAATLAGDDVRRWIQSFWDSETPRQLRCEERTQAEIELRVLRRDVRYLSLQTRAELTVEAMRKVDSDGKERRAYKNERIDCLTQGYQNKWVVRRAIEIIQATPDFEYADSVRRIEPQDRYLLAWYEPEPPLEAPTHEIGSPLDDYIYDPSLDAKSSLDDIGLIPNLVVPSREFVAAWHERRWQMRKLPRRERFVPLYPDALMRLASRVYDTGEWDALFNDVFTTPELTAAWMRENGVPEDVPLSALKHALHAEWQNRYPEQAEDDIRGAWQGYDLANPYLSFEARESYEEMQMMNASGYVSERELLQDRFYRREAREMAREIERWGSLRPPPEEEEKNDFHYDLQASYDEAYAAAYGPQEHEPDLRWPERDAELALIFPDAPTPDTPQENETPS